MTNDTSTKNLILVPAVITLAVTLLRLTGELLHWSPTLFNPAPGGGGALVGIAWLVPVFGAWFGWKLALAGERPASVGKAIGFAFLGFAIVPALGFLAVALGMSQQSFASFGVFIVLAIIGAFLAYRAWPGLGRTLFAYALAARIPVAIVMLDRDARELGHALRRGAARLPRDEPVIAEVVHDRPRAAAHDLDLVHDRAGRDHGIDRRGGGGAATGRSGLTGRQDRRISTNEMAASAAIFTRSTTTYPPCAIPNRRAMSGGSGRARKSA